MSIVRRFGFLVALMLLLPRGVYADSIAVGDSVTFSPGLGTIGGAGTIVTVNDDPTTAFVSFCMQADVGDPNTDYSTTMYVTGMSDYATYQPPVAGGDASGRDFLTSQTAWLFTQYRDGSLTGFDGSTNAYDALQWAIWQLQNERVIPDGMAFSGLANSFISLANDAVAAGYSGIGDVRVVNLNYADGSDAQDQLTMLPEPSSWELLGLGVAALFFFGRRRATASPCALA